MKNNLDNILGQQAGNVAPEQAQSYPNIQWMNGQKGLKDLGLDDVRYRGGFVAKAAQVGDEFPIGSLIEWEYQSGGTSDVFAIGSARFVVLASRLDWFVGDKGKPDWLPEYQDGAKGRNRWLILLEGAEDWHAENGPLMLSLYGTNGVAMAKEVLSPFGSDVHKAASKMAGRTLDAYTFWVNVEAGKHRKANPKFSSMVTPPQLLLEAYDTDGKTIKLSSKTVDEFVVASYVGDDVMQLAASFWDEAVDWSRMGPTGNFGKDVSVDESGEDVVIEYENEEDEIPF